MILSVASNAGQLAVITTILQSQTELLQSMNERHLTVVNSALQSPPLAVAQAVDALANMEVVSESSVHRSASDYVHLFADALGNNGAYHIVRSGPMPNRACLCLRTPVVDAPMCFMKVDNSQTSARFAKVLYVLFKLTYMGDIDAFMGGYMLVINDRFNDLAATSTP